jgi:hypothetical protein
MKFIFILLFIVVNLFVNGQVDTLKELPLKNNKKWNIKSSQGLNGSQTSFMNWNTGGRTNFSLLGFINSSAYLKTRKLKWENDMNLALGGVKYFDKEIDPIQKTDDRIDIASNFGYNLYKTYYFSLNTSFKTQALDGYKYPNDSVITSRFMAPGYVSLALGFDYLKEDHFAIFVSPFAPKMTFVNDQTLANAGAFGVRKADYDEVGNLIRPGARFRGEFGSYIKLKWNQTLAKNIDVKSKLELFSNYNNNPENIDVNAEAIFNFKVNSWCSANVQLNLVYDDDIQIRLPNGVEGPRTQFKSILGLGLSYKMSN